MNICIVDNHLPYVTKTTNWLKSNTGCNILFTATNGYECIKQLNTVKELPNIVLLDVQMRPIDGFATAFYLKNYYPNIKIIMVSGHIDVNIVGQSIICGADGYVFKGEREKIITTALETVSADNFYLDIRLQDSTLQQTLETFWQSKKQFWNKYNDNDNKKLSPREKTFLQLAATALNNTEIAELMLVEKRTVETMYARIAKKLNVTSNKELALYALQNGFAIHANYCLTEFMPEEIA